ncbi:hypothetical protein G9A89_022536 [Geosiphon pyriformis]|nr:hypothetical protein G9A89_022536 [Geosiphon pyriformis]
MDLKDLHYSKSKITDLLVKLNSNDIAGMATKIRLANLQTQRWSAHNVLKYPTNEQSKPEINLIANIMQIMKERGILFKSSDNTYGIPESSRPHAHLIETVITPGITYIKVRSVLRKKNILYLHQVLNKDGSLITWMNFTRKYRQSNSGRISRWFKILEATLIMDEYKKIDEIKISTDNSLVKANSGNVKEAAVFITYEIKANFEIGVDGMLLLTKTETKAVLLALEAMPYNCKLTLNTDSQAVNAIKTVIGKKKIGLNINKVTTHTGISEYEMTNKLAKEATAFNMVGWAYNAKNINYISSYKEVELDLNIRYFLNQQTKMQKALN